MTFNRQIPNLYPNIGSSSSAGKALDFAIYRLLVQISSGALIHIIGIHGKEGVERLGCPFG